MGNLRAQWIKLMNRLSRGEFLKVLSATLTSILSAVTGLLAFNNQANRPVVKTVSIPLDNLHPSLEGFKILQISDTHLYPYTRPELIQQAVDLCNARGADLLALTGDYVWLKAEPIFELARLLSGVQTKHGIYAVIGNHDIWTDVDIIRAGFERHNISVLCNQGLTITVGEGSLYLAGLDDGQSGAPDLDKALESAPPGAPVVLLFHEPDLADNVAQDSRVSLQLAGHTHGGQIRWPWVGPLILPYLGRKYDMGLYRVNHMWLYTNPGLGTISIPLRYNCPPEVTEIILTRGSSS